MRVVRRGYAAGRPMVSKWRRPCCARASGACARSTRAVDANAISRPGPPRVFVRYPDWSARGDLIVFERAEMTGNIWLLDRPIN